MKNSFTIEDLANLPSIKKEGANLHIPGHEPLFLGPAEKTLFSDGITKTTEHHLIPLECGCFAKSVEEITGYCQAPVDGELCGNLLHREHHNHCMHKKCGIAICRTHTHRKNSTLIYCPQHRKRWWQFWRWL